VLRIRVLRKPSQFLSTREGQLRKRRYSPGNHILSSFSIVSKRQKNVFLTCLNKFVYINTIDLLPYFTTMWGMLDMHKSVFHTFVFRWILNIRRLANALLYIRIHPHCHPSTERSQIV